MQAQQAQELREQVADVAVSSLQQTVDGIARDLERGVGLPSLASAPDTAIVVFSAEQITAIPDGRLLCYPLMAAGREAPAAMFASGEALERRGGSYLQAARWFGDLAAVADDAVRAGANIRQARNLRRAGQTDAALAVLQRVPQASGVAVAGVPADLFARWMECSLLEEAGRKDALQARARALHTDLLRGRWPLDRAAFECTCRTLQPGQLTP